MSQKTLYSAASHVEITAPEPKSRRRWHDPFEKLYLKGPKKIPAYQYTPEGVANILDSQRRRDADRTGPRPPPLNRFGDEMPRTRELALARKLRLAEIANRFVPARAPKLTPLEELARRKDQIYHSGSYGSVASRQFNADY